MSVWWKRISAVLLFSAILVSGGAGETRGTPGRAAQFVWICGEECCTGVQLQAFPEAVDYWNVQGPNNYVYEESVYDDSPIITVTNHAELMEGARLLAMITHGSEEGWYAAEYYATLDSAYAALDRYRAAGLDDDRVRLGYTQAGTEVLMVSREFVEWHAGNLGSRAIADLSWCHSASMAEAFFTIGATSVMAYANTVTLGRVCRNFETRWNRLGCREDEDGVYPSTALGANRLPEAVLLSATGTYADSVNSINPNCDCDNWSARILEWGIDRGGRVLFVTNYERRTEAFRVYGFRGNERSLLAELPPRGDSSGRVTVYEAAVSPGYERYQVAEIDGGRRWRTASDWKEPGDFPARLEEMAARAGEDLGSIRGEPAREGPRGPAVLSSGAWGDAAVYAPDSAWAAPLLAQLASQGLEAVLYIGDGSPEDITAAYSYTHSSNVSRNGEIGEDRYPVWPGPELYLVGRSSDGSVRTGSWPDDEWENCNQPSCRGDFDYTDVDGDGRPNGPVSRIFAVSSEEVARYVHFSELYNESGSGASSTVLLCAGDLDYGSGGSFPGPDLWLDRVESGLARIPGLGPAVRFRRSGYGSSEEASAAGTALVNAGVRQIWAMGPLSGYRRIPSSVFFGTNFDADSLVRDQAFILFAPGCEVAADWGFAATYDLLLRKLMTNAPGHTGCAGAVAHWSGGWGSKHDTWASYVLEKYMDAEPGDPISLVLWRAFIRCTDDCPWMVDYCRSAVYVGARTLVRGSEVAVRPGAGPAATGLDLRVSPTVTRGGGISIRFQAPSDGNASVRIYDVRGRPVRTLGDERFGPGPGEVLWDGRDDRGRDVGSGIYFARVRSPRGSEARKIAVIR
ncbi:MAG: hypothetical protein ABIK65_11555 [Candidatus Eisenbacteria bacterium]